jgi:signal transduction histidine kinase
MRLPLRYQILLPLVGILMLTVTALSLVFGWIAVRNAERNIESRIQVVARTIAGTAFPLTPTVLNQIRKLTDAELVLQSRDGEVLQATVPDLPVPVLSESEWLRLSRDGPVYERDDRFVRATIPVRSPGGDAAVLHLIYSQADLARQQRLAVLPAALVGLTALVVATAFAFWISGRLSRPIRELSERTARIAAGDFRPVAPSGRNDEVRELQDAMNRMAERLAHYESEIRRTERVRTLGLLGGGLAHQLRNAVTGALLAIDLHGERTGDSLQSGELEIARRQLLLMEKYLKRFLSLGMGVESETEPVDLPGLIRSIVPLLEPAARHGGVQLVATLPDDPLYVSGSPDGLEQVVLNLVGNAIDAARSTVARTSDVPPPIVRVELHRISNGRVQLLVADNGPGPPSDLAGEMFEPFVSRKPEGIGLGLSIVRQVVEQLGGHVQWQRRDGFTEFRVEFAGQPTSQQAGAVDVIDSGVDEPEWTSHANELVSESAHRASRHGTVEQQDKP